MVPVGSEVSFPNHDQIHHHVYSFSRTKRFEIPLYKGESGSPVRFDTVGTVKLGCNIHDWMSGVIVVVPTSFYAMTDGSGSFILRDVPDGTHPVAVWHERATTSVDDTVQRIDAAPSAPPLTFTLALSPPQPRPAMRGVRSYE